MQEKDIKNEDDKNISSALSFKEDEFIENHPPIDLGNGCRAVWCNNCQSYWQCGCIK